MRVLALDTALNRCQAAVVAVEDGRTRTLSEAGGPSEGDSEAIVERAAAALADAGCDFAAIDRVAVTVGPGSFTGVRVGIAYAKGIAFARSLPLAGVSTLEAMAGPSPGRKLCLINARHGAVYAQLFGVDDAAPPARLPLQEALALAAHHGAQVIAHESVNAVLDTHHRLCSINLSDIAVIAGRRAAGDLNQPVQALYLAPVDARPQAHKALAS